jgi:hypothetical protein
VLNFEYLLFILGASSYLLIQGVDCVLEYSRPQPHCSRLRLLKLELISSGGPLTWATIMTRWIMSYVSIAAAGLGYAYLFFNKEARIS